MAVRKLRKNRSYGIENALQGLMPQAIIADRDPGVQDFAELGQIWVNKTAQTMFGLAGFNAAGQAIWSTPPVGGNIVATGLTVNGNSQFNGNAAITGTLGVTGDTTAGNLTVNGNLVSATLDVTSVALINITSTLNAAPAIQLIANGGAAEQVLIRSTQGTAANSVLIDSTAGGIDIEAALGLSLQSNAADLDINSNASSVNIIANEAAADAVVVHALNAAGGIQLRAGTAGISIGTVDETPVTIANIAPTVNRTVAVANQTVVAATTTDTISIGGGGATTNADSIKTVNIAHGNVAVGENNLNLATGNRTSGTHLVNLSTGTGTKTVNVGNADALTTVNVNAITRINNNVNANTSINTGNSTGVVAIGNAAAGAITLDTAAGISLDGATASNFTVTGAGVDLTLSSVGGSVVIDGSEAVADAVQITASGAAGGIALASTNGVVAITSGTGAINIGADAAAHTVTLGSTTGGAASVIQAGTGGIALNAAGQVAVQPATDTQASPTAASTVNARVGVVTFTGFTTAMGGTQVFTITNSTVVAGSAVLAFADNLDASGNGARVAINGTITAANTLSIQVINNGAGALGAGDDVHITFFVLS